MLTPIHLRDKAGPLLANAIQRFEKAGLGEAGRMTASTLDGPPPPGESPLLPVIIKIPTHRPRKGGENWFSYRSRIEGLLAPLQEKIYRLMRIETRPLITANSLQFAGTIPQILRIQEESMVNLVELDPEVQLTMMDNAVHDVGLPVFHQRNPGYNGAGVRVAVLDSGVDIQHPFLRVARSVSTCGEPVGIPGDHGTHCAGSIASTDLYFPGIAPGVELLNVKVLNSKGSGRETFITQGIDAALDMGAHIISMSLGFNHLPTWSERGHGWSCPDGNCPLCTAVDNASELDDALVVVAAGNEHYRAENLREIGEGSSFDTELGCPGQARSAITVGAITKSTFRPAGFSSHGPTAYGAVKPDISAPGVNITSTVPVPRDTSGHPMQNAPRYRLFGRKSGTSMATPIVAGALALLAQKHMSNGQAWNPGVVREELFSKGLMALTDLDEQIVGKGRLYLGEI